MASSQPLLLLQLLQVRPLLLLRLKKKLLSTYC
jgi:hypothetical protein